MVLASTSVAAAQQEPAAPNPLAPQVILINGRVWTGVEGAPQAEALAIRDGRLAAVGTTAEVRALADDKTIVVDVGGRRIVPGLTDSHTHFIWTGLHLRRLDLRTATSKEDFCNRIAAAVAKLPPGKWLQGGQYTVESWEKPESPRKEWIDELTPGTPVFLTRTDGHQALVNSVALQYARIDREGPKDPPGGEIERDPDTGEPTGILKDEAMLLVSKLIPQPTDDEKYAALMLAQKMAHAWGITSIHDMSTPGDVPIYAAAAQRGDLALRVISYVDTTEFEKSYESIKPYLERGRMYRVAGYKAFMDGSLGSRTAYMREPFADSTEDTKYPRGLRSGHATDLEAFARQVRWAHEKGLQMAIHAIGDQANHELLDIYASCPAVTGRRHRIEHVQHLLAEDVERFAKLGVIASMQPLHKADDGRWAAEVLGPERSKLTYAFASLLSAGATVAFGSDCPVATANPFEGIAAAVMARTLDGDVWVPEQSISRELALRSYTAAPAYAVFAEKEWGTLAPGMAADFVVLDRDIMEIPIEEIGAAEAWMTVVDGRMVHRASP